MVPALIQTLQDRDPGVRLAAVNALHVVTADDPQAKAAAAALVATLRDADPRVRAQAAGILSTLKPDPKLALPPLISAALPEVDAPAATTGPISGQELIDRSQCDHARASAVAALGILGPHDLEVHKALVSLADDRVPEVRMVAARVLGEIGPEAPGAIGALRKLVTDPDLYIQARAITSLGSFPAEYVVLCPLYYQAYLSKQRPLQEGAELSLAKLIKSKQFHASEAIRSQDAALRFVAVYGLDPKSDTGFKMLEEALKDEDPGVRIVAAANLAKASARRHELAIKTLESLANDKEEDVRNQMHRSLQLLTPRPPRGGR